MSVRVLCLTRYGRLGASSRLRTLQFVPHLRTRGFEVDVVPLLEDAYVERLYRGGTDWQSVLGGYLRRAQAMRSARRHDVVWVEKEALPWTPWLFERALYRAPVVVDYDDAVFHYYDTHRSTIVRRILSDKIDRVMAAAHCVMAGNPYLADRARAAGARRVETIPTVVDLDRYALADPPKPPGSPTIGWIGNPGTVRFLELIEQPLARAAERGGARVVAVGVRTPPLKHVRVEPLAWSEATEVEAIQSFDVGVMPLPDEPFERGKCGYKLIQYMACGKPVVASPVGVNRDIVEHGVNGFLASTPQEWALAFDRLLGDASLRARMGRAGRSRVESLYSLAVATPRIADILRDVADGRSR